ncbi:hypothetical protein SLS62_011148 [Diatrype stigma]|uniref:Uncharacterized protein n=1 Tax=Diatrype stigma TaxID=117547 RepID=A0AAN9UCM4_9PEZI
MTTPAEAPAPVVFRGKKRKAYRQRGETGNDVHADVDNVSTAPASDLAHNMPISSTDNPSPAPPQAAGAIPVQSGAKSGEDEDAAEDERGLSVAEVLRRRNARRSKLGGVKFSAVDSAPPVAGAAGGEFDYNNSDDLSLMIREEEGHVLERSSSAAAGVTKRFAPQTGLSSELINKHMEEYIEAKLAKKHEAAAAAAEAAEAASFSALQQQQQRDRDSANHDGDDYDNYSYDSDDDDDEPAAKIYAEYAGKLTSTSQPRERHTALQGKLLEVDLGDEVRSRNAAMTERARRRLLGEAVEDDDNARSGRNGRPGKVRLGRDGKPWRPRNRRGSDDVKRDQIVEAILHENSLDVYEKPKPRVLPPSRASVAAAAAAASAATITGVPPTVPNPNATTQAGTSAEANGVSAEAGAGVAEVGAGEDEEGALDDRIAEQFRREFMEAMAERRQRRRKAPLPPSKAAAAQAKRESDEILRGPKLGGSRNARAAMRDILLKQQEERKAQQPGGSSVKPRGLPPRRTGGRR